MLIVDESVSEKKHLIRPEHINAQEHLWNAFESNETEISAAWIVRLCQEELGGWKSFTREQIEGFYNQKDLYRFTFNRLLDGGVVVLGADGKYRVTHDFICRCFWSSPILEFVSPTVAS